MRTLAVAAVIPRLCVIRVPPVRFQGNAFEFAFGLLHFHELPGALIAFLKKTVIALKLRPGSHRALAVVIACIPCQRLDPF
jgi:hypothetical protein